jgi:hypothetical protein
LPFHPERPRNGHYRWISPFIIAAVCAFVTLAGSVLPANAALRTFAGISVTADGSGYGLISNAGEVYAFGSTVYHGNPSGFSGSIVGLSVTADGKGYAAISSTGQVYAYGTVAYHGNPTGFTGSIAGISVTGNGAGYAAESSSGQVYAYGTVKYWGNGDPGSTSPGPLGSRISSIATTEYGNSGHNAEHGGANCNYYTTALGTGSAGCANGWRHEEWCADFAKWVWLQAGAVTSQLTAGARSFLTYGQHYGTWHAGNLSGIQVGDVIGWNYGTSTTGDDHVSVVVGINSNGSVRVLDGNWSNAITAHTIPANATSGSSATPSMAGETLSGYVSPVS